MSYIVNCVILIITMSRVIPRFKQALSLFALNSKKLSKDMYAISLNISPSEVGMVYIACGIVFTTYNFKNIFESEIRMYNVSGSLGKIFCTASTAIGFTWHCGTWPVGLMLYDDKNMVKYMNEKKGYR
jgi:hypothetical protein